MINVAIMGHGVVGSGVAEILINHCNRINHSTDEDVNVKYILDLREFNDLSYSEKFIKDFNIILNDENIKIVVEVMGGLNPAYDFVKKCLQNGKSVVTSNKELVATNGAELIKIAKDNNVNFLFEASVGGGIPVITPMIQCLCANEINEITGILNGTTNYILDKMIVDNMNFESALKLAQEKGFAEKNPSADIDGDDACRKICILAALGFGKHVYPNQVDTEGITKITLDDVGYADNFNCVIKLIGHTKKLGNGKITATVRPTLIKRDNILSNVNGVFNAVMVDGDQTGEVMFYGKGAGKEATASAVVSDVIDCAKHLDKRKCLYWEDGEKDYVNNNSNLPEQFYILLKSDNYNKLLEQYKLLFPDNLISVKNEYRGEIAFITENTFESDLKNKISQINNITEFKILHTMF